MTTALAAQVERKPLLTNRQILTILAGLMVGMFLASLDQTIVSTSIRTIADDLHGLSLQAWVTTAYLITSTLTTPLYGKLSDLYGRKPLFLTAITIFMVGSVACTFSQSMFQLAGFRALQGLGAGGLLSLAMTILGDIVSPRQRAKYQGYLVAVFGTSSVLGPLIGGFLAGQSEILGITGWRWVFLVNVPIGAVALVIVAKVLNLPHRSRNARVDWPGALALALGLVPLLLVAEQGRTWGWASSASLTCFGIGVVGMALFGYVEHRYGDDALLPLRSFRIRAFGVGTAGILLVGMGMFGGMAALPLYLQIVKGATPTAAGLLILPMVLGMMSMSIFSGRIISRTGQLKMWPVLGVSLMVVGLLLISGIGVTTPLWLTASYMLVFGWGLGCSMQPMTLTMQNALPARDMGVATASATFFRQMGGTIGTAVFLSILFGTAPDRINAAFRAAGGTPQFQAALADPALRADPVDQSVLSAVASGTAGRMSLHDTSFLNHLDSRLALPFLQGYSSAMSLTFLCGTAVLAVGLATVLLLPRVALRQVSGLEAQRAQQVDEARLAVLPATSAPVAAAEVTAAPVAVAPVAAPPGAAAVVAGPVVPAQAGAPEPQRWDRLRDQLLGELVPDLDGALAKLAAAERARDGSRTARRALDAHTRALAEARRGLRRHGLTDAQIDELLELSPTEVTRAG
jgi:EmrB/QacA subfamily drug resistance transporter